MMKASMLMLLFLVMLIDPTLIGKINAAKADAKKAFNEGHYKDAIKKYRYLIDSLDVDEDEVRMNLAHAYYLAKDTANARPLYQNLTQSSKNIIKSNALQQLGILNNSQGKSEMALHQFKQAIKADPTNQDARYNYEMLKKKLEEKKKEDQKNQDKENKDDKKDQNKDQQNKDDKNKKDQNKDQQQKDQEQKDKEKKEQEEKEKKEQEKKGDKEEQEKKDAEEKKGEKKDKAEDKAKDEQQKKDENKVPKEVAEKLEMSQEKAAMILEAMRNQEVQYLQQNKRKATKPKEKGKPDW
jgi:hypothetical protein